MSVSPNLLRELDAAVKASFQSSRDGYFFSLILCTVAVVIGVAIEEIEYFLTWRSVRSLLPIKILLPAHRLDTIARRVSKVGWILIVIGVAGEGIYEARVSRADGWIQEFNSILFASQEAELIGLGDVTAIARRDATDAAMASKQANGSATSAMDLATGARQEADSFEREINDARQDASEAKSLLGEARQLATEARQQAGEASAGVNQLKANRSLSNTG